MCRRQTHTNSRKQYHNSRDLWNKRDFGNFSRPSGKTTTIKNRFLFLYLRVEPKATFVDEDDSRGREKVWILLFTAFRYEHLFWSTVVRVWIVRLFIREKILFVEKTHDEKSWRMAKVDFSWIWQKIREKKEKKGDSRLGTKSMLITFLGKLPRH